MATEVEAPSIPYAKICRSEVKVRPGERKSIRAQSHNAAGLQER